ncbi:hypothetical protein CRG98_048212 [Punica granatum]|uniref:Uncharacterized protein n=1 Tax=Punica granatum TaxID=22663 RepID=A0A2I0HI57_PUNGR|nr:hypothetical protein CRG98_048212 [Punica granatum]
MFIEEELSDDAVYVAGGDGEVEFDEEEVIVTGDGMPSLVVRRSCMTSRAADEEWLRNNIFQSTCTIGNKICRFMIDSGSYENIVSAEPVQKLSLRKIGMLSSPNLRIRLPPPTCCPLPNFKRSCMMQSLYLLSWAGRL